MKLERHCGLEDIDSSVDRLEAHLQLDTCRAVELMHSDLEVLRAKTVKVRNSSLHMFLFLLPFLFLRALPSRY